MNIIFHNDFTKLTNPTSSELGFTHGIFKAHRFWNLWFTSIFQVCLFSSFKIKNMHMSLTTIKQGFSKGSKNLGKSKVWLLVLLFVNVTEFK